MLEVNLLGQFEVQKDGVPILIPSRPAQSLLAYSILTAGVAHRREKLAGLLWPDSSEDNARSNLRQALWRVRKALNYNSPPEQSYIISDNFTVEFNPNSNYWLDVYDLERQAKSTNSTDQLKEILTLYRGELLPGFYDDWVMLKRERLQAVFEREVERLLEQLKVEQHWEEILEWGEHWLAYGQNPEPAYRGLMYAYSMLGNQSKVAYTYDRCVKALRDDLGVEPSVLTKDLYAQLVQGDDAIGTVLVRNPPTPASDQKRTSDRPPYKGLLYFEEADGELFFGRELLTKRLVDRLIRVRFLVLIGASGSGKSSLVRAGIAPTIKVRADLPDSLTPSGKRKNGYVQVITPTDQPLESLASTLKMLPQSSVSTSGLRAALEQDPLSYVRAVSQALPEGGRFVLIVDQFEELFTLCHDPFEREAFVDHLLSAISGDLSANVSVLLALRADFYEHCAQYDSLRQALVDHQEYLGPMSAEDLQRVIEEPARLNGLEIEPGLTGLILAEIGDEPGRLPLLSHALLETWNRRSGHNLTLKGYTESGGVRGAISRTAENVYQKLSPEQQEIARQIFLHLTELREDTADTRHRITRSDFLDQREDTTGIQSVLNVLAEARLVTLGENTIEVAHEALIRTWGRLRTWLDDSRDELRQRRTLTIVAREWANAGRERSYLATGARLSQFEAFVTNSDIKLGQLEQTYLEASLEERDRQKRRERARIAHEARLEKRSRNVLRSLILVLLVTTIGALILSGFAWRQRRIARQNEIAAQALALTSGAQFAASQEDYQLALSLAWTASQLDQSNVQAQLALSDLAYAPGIWRRMLEHTDQVSAVAFDPEGKQALSASWDKTLILWEVSSGQPVRQFSGHSDRVTSVMFNPDGKTALSGSVDTTLIMWDVGSGSIIRRYEGHRGEITGIAISPDGRVALSGSSDQTLVLWNLASGEVIRSFTGHNGEVHSIAFSPDGSMIASGSSDTELILWDAATGNLIRRFEGHLGAVTSVAFSPDGETILSGSLDQVLILWDVESGEPVRRYEGHQDQVNTVAFSPDGRAVISAGGSEEAFNTTQEPVLILWDVASGEALNRFKGHSAPVTTAAFSPDGKMVLSGSSDMSLILWGLTSGAEIQQFEGHSSAVNSVAISADGKIALSGSADTSLIIWEVSTGQPIRQIFSDTIIHAAALSPNGQYVLSGNPDGRLRLWDVTTGQTAGDLVGHTGPVTSVVFSPDGNMALSGSLDRRLILWDVGSRQISREFTGHSSVVNSVAFRLDGKQALSGSFDHTMILWDIDSGQAIRSFPVQDSVINSVAFSPDGNAGLSGLTGGELILWDLESGVEIRRFTGHSGPVYAVAFSPDGKTALSGSMDQFLILWDVASGQPIRRFLGHTDAVRAVAFSPDGQKALSGSLDNSLLLWRIDSLEDLLAWTEANRFIVELSCEQRAFYRLEPLCETWEVTP
jgi:WD40 repeat protein/DNA-binding SARP family transcriptional activator